MSEIRDKARAIIDRTLPGNTVITSNGPTGPKYTEMTGLTHKRLIDSWASGINLTGCNGFTGWFGVQMGSPVALGGFDLEGIVKKAGKPEAWIPSTPGIRPKYGDILRHATFHVDVALDFEGAILWRAAGGQGGSASQCDIIKRVRGQAAYNPARLLGWIDMEIFLADQWEPDVPSIWFEGWWKVSDGDAYYYFFEPNGGVSYVETRPARTALRPPAPVNSGSYRYDASQNQIVINWNPVAGQSTQETFWNASVGASMMNARSNRYQPLVATRM